MAEKLGSWLRLRRSQSNLCLEHIIEMDKRILMTMIPTISLAGLGLRPLLTELVLKFTRHRGGTGLHFDVMQQVEHEGILTPKNLIPLKSYFFTAGC